VTGEILEAGRGLAGQVEDPGRGSARNGGTVHVDGEEGDGLAIDGKARRACVGTYGSVGGDAGGDAFVDGEEECNHRSL